MSQTITLPKLHAAQAQIVSEAKRFSVVVTGRRFGKTVLGIDRILRVALDGKPTGWFAPTYRHLAAVWKDLAVILGDIADSNKNEKLIELPGGGSIECWSMDSQSPARSRKYACVVIDEAAHTPDLKDQWNDA